ncbi:MAG: HAMP domain-containing sensor histidine kinase [Candidatus Anammoxibacter sp.]
MKHKENTILTINDFPKSKLAVKFSVVVSIMMSAAILASCLYVYEKNSALILRNLQNQLQLAANTIAISVDGDKFEQLNGKVSMNTPEYRQIKGVIKQFVTNNQYLGFEDNNIYMFRRISKNLLEFTVMLHDKYVGNPYKIRDEMLPTLEIGTPGYTDLYNDENGAWVSAYAAILNSSNNVVGIVETDFHNNVYLAAVKNEIYSIIPFAVAGIILAVSVIVFMSRTISKPISEISKATILLANGDFEVSVPVTTSDETGVLTRAFNYMARELKEKEFIRKKNQELTEAYHKCDALNQALEEASRAKSEFLSIAAHDLKNPLQIIMGYSQVLQTHSEENGNIYRNAENISKGAKRMLDVIDQLLETDAIETGKLKLDKKLTDIGELIKKVVDNNSSLAKNKNQILGYSNKLKHMVVVDEDRIYEVMDNLISNAVKFSPCGKNINVYVKRVNSANSDHGKTIIEVKDMGPGLTANDLENLFGKYSRLSALPTSGESSTGLGLSIVKQLVELHGGKVWAESKGKNKGSTFFVELS